MKRRVRVHPREAAQRLAATTLALEKIRCTPRLRSVRSFLDIGRSSRAAAGTLTRFLRNAQTNSACAIHNVFRPIRQTIRALNFRHGLAQLEILHIRHVVDRVLRLFTEWIVRLILHQISLQRISVKMVFDLMNKFFHVCFC